jgi:hypothetical protein
MTPTPLTREQIERVLMPFREWMERAQRSRSLVPANDWNSGYRAALEAVKVELEVALLAHGAPTAPKEQP